MTVERSAIEILHAARERITPIEQWTTGAYARDSHGDEVRPYSGSACEWCLVGAVAAESGMEAGQVESQSEAYAFLRQACRVVHPTTINDGQGHAAALGRLDTAIDLAEAAA